LTNLFFLFQLHWHQAPDCSKTQPLSKHWQITGKLSNDPTLPFLSRLFISHAFDSMENQTSLTNGHIR